MSQLSVVAIFDVMAAMRKKEPWQLEANLREAFEYLLQDESLDPAMVALMCTLPSEAYLAGLSTPVEVELLHRAREALILELASDRLILSFFSDRYQRELSNHV